MLIAGIFSSGVNCVRQPYRAPSTGTEGGRGGIVAQGTSQRYVLDAVGPRLRVIVRACEVLFLGVEACFFVGRLGPSGIT